MKLYDLPKGAKLKVETNRGVEMATFHHIDGMYSYITLDKDDEVVHLGAVQEMTKVDDHYEIKDEIGE